MDLAIEGEILVLRSTQAIPINTETQTMVPFIPKTVRSLAGAAVFALAMAIIPSAHATTVGSTLTRPFWSPLNPSSPAPAESAPVTVTFTELGSGKVSATITTHFTQASEYINQLDLALNTSSLSFVRNLSVSASNIGGPSFLSGVYKNEPALHSLTGGTSTGYDLRLNFGDNKVGGLGTHTYTIVLSEAGLSLDNFLIPGHSPAVLLVKGIDATLGGHNVTTSQWMATPIPAALPLFASALVGLGLFGRRANKQKAA